MSYRQNTMRSCEEREEILASRCMASQAPVHSVAGMSQRSSVIFFASGIIDLTSPSSVVEGDKVIDLTTPPPSPLCVADETVSVEGSPSRSSVADETVSVEGSPSPSSVADETVSVERSPSPSSVADKTVSVQGSPSPLSVADETLSVERSPSPSSVADETVSVEGSPSTSSSSAANIESRTKQTKKAVRTKMNLWRLVRMFRGKRTFCCDKCQFKTQYKMPMWVHLDSHKLRRLNKRNTCTGKKMIYPAGVLEGGVSRTGGTESNETAPSHNDDQNAEFEGSTENLSDHDFQTLHSQREKKKSVENLAELHEGTVKYVHQCDSCGYKALTKLEVLKHADDFHKKLTNYNCSECSYQTDNKRKLIRHCATHMELNRLKQSKCTVNLIRLTQPKATSGEVKIYKCVQCNYKSNLKGNLKIHMRKHTNEKPYECERCVSRFTWKYQLDKHMVADHSAKKLLFNCGQCDYRTTYKSNLVIHKRTHSGKKPFYCSQCDFSTVQKQNLTIHEMIHSGNKPYHCKKCEYRTARKHSLVIHDRIHSGEKPYHCKKCEYRAARKHHLVIHERIHSGDKPYHCKKCEYRTARRYDLVIHERIHSGDKPFHCSQCDHRAVNKSNLTNHLKRRH